MFKKPRSKRQFERLSEVDLLIRFPPVMSPEDLPNLVRQSLETTETGVRSSMIGKVLIRR
jgi:hypothetical protein